MNLAIFHKLNLYDFITGQFDPRDHNLNKRDRVPLDNATRKISEIIALWIRRERFSKFEKGPPKEQAKKFGQDPVISFWYIV